MINLRDECHFYFIETRSHILLLLDEITGAKKNRVSFIRKRQGLKGRDPQKINKSLEYV